MSYSFLSGQLKNSVNGIALLISLLCFFPDGAFSLGHEFGSPADKPSSASPVPEKHESMSKLDFYPVPQDLKLRMERQKSKGGDFLYIYRGVAEFLIGKPTDAEFFFESTPDLSVETKPVQFRKIPEGKKMEYLIPVRKGFGKAPFGKTWVRMRVKYLPDYEAMLKKITSEKEKYPALGLYTRLLREIRALKVRKKPVNTGISVFPREDDVLQRILDGNSQ